MTNVVGKMIYFSEDDQAIGAECPKCGRVIKVYKEGIKETEGGLLTEKPITCVCKRQYTEIEMGGKKRNTTADIDLPSSGNKGNRDLPVKCPKCGSLQVNSSKKGFGLGKAVGGGLLLGPVGLLGGLFGSRKVYITCLKCGKQWNAGK